MSIQEAFLPTVATVDEQFALEALMAEPEAGISDAPRYVAMPQALLLLLFKLSSPLPKEPKKQKSSRPAPSRAEWRGCSSR